jgi:trehalose synthase
MVKLVEVKLDTLSKDALGEYQKLNKKVYQNISSVAKKTKQKTIIHVSSTACGGGVAELLRSQVAIEKSFGIESRWLVIKTEPSFFDVTKKIHNLLQGKAGTLSEEEKALYLSVNSQLKKQLSEFLEQFKSCIVVIHDPQPLPILDVIPKSFSAILRLHIDLSMPNPSLIEFLKTFIINYDAVVVSNKDYLKALPWIKKSKVKIIYPAIDPFSEKNRPMTLVKAKEIVAQCGIDPTKTIISQISRFDHWKDPLGVIEAYHSVKKKIPNLQLVLMGLIVAQDDPEAISFFKQVKKYAQGDPDIYLFYSQKQLKSFPNDIFVNALQTASEIIIQASIREGFGLTITEAMWKGKPTIARKNSGSSVQIKNNKNGILVNSPEETAKAIICLLQNKKLKERIGKVARLSTKQHFLIQRFVLDNLKLYNKI